MKTLVVYDSVYGNTEQIARAVSEAVASEVKVLHANEASLAELEGIGLLIAGAPTQAGRPTTAMNDFLGKIDSLNGISVAAFDTRIPQKWVKLFGFAAGKIAKKLKQKGGNLVLDPEPFFVTDTKGPLKDGELERAAAWGKDVIKMVTARSEVDSDDDGGDGGDGGE